MKHATFLLTLLLISATQESALADQPDRIPPGYRVETIATPRGVTFGVAGLAVAPNGDVYAGTRFGEVWRYRQNGWQLFADGLNEIAGMRIDPQTSEILVAQKPELTRLTDTDGDGTADEYETVTSAWGFTGNYHEFSFGPVKDSQGNLYGTLNLSHGIGPSVGGAIMTIGARDRGTAYRLTPQGEFSTFAWGLRSPAGVAIHPKTDELFYTDNQGDWNASSSLHQLQEGAFYGHPASLLFHPDFQGTDLNQIPTARYDEMRQKPVIWIPHGEMANSPGNPVFDMTEGRFGPFQGQLFVGDQTRSNIFRCVLDRVDGQYQGACIEFINHLQCGAVRLDFAPDGSLWVGQTSRGWGSVGGAPYGVQRIVYDAQAKPFEIHSVALTRKGFDIRFTQPVADNTSLESSRVRLQHWGYLYHAKYGSPKVTEKVVECTRLSVSEDRRTVSLELPELQPDRVYRIDLPGMKSKDGSQLTTAIAYYTLNRLVAAQ